MLSMRDLPYPRWKGLRHIKEHTLEDDLIVTKSHIVKKGTTLKIWQSENFGCILLQEPAANGQRLFLY